MDVTELVRKRLKYLLEVNKLPINRLATYSGIPASTLKNILYSKSENPGIETIKALCDGLDITLVDFFSSKEFAEPWKANSKTIR